MCAQAIALGLVAIAKPPVSLAAVCLLELAKMELSNPRRTKLKQSATH